MTTKHTPATPLPWHPRYTGMTGNSLIVEAFPDGKGSRIICQVVSGKEFHETEQDCNYLAHAANAYPRLVEALRNEIKMDQQTMLRSTKMELREVSIALLRELGEE